MALPGDTAYPLWGWGADQATELTGAAVTDDQLTRAHRELERVIAQRVTADTWYLDAVWDQNLDPEWPYLQGYPTRRAWLQAVSWQAAWRQTVPVQPDAEPLVKSERLGDHQVEYAGAVSVGGRAVASEAHRELTAAGLLAGRLTGYSR